MSLPNQLIVSGAGTAAVNGTYTNVSPTLYTKDGDTDYKLHVSSYPPHLSFLPTNWTFYYIDSSPANRRYRSTTTFAQNSPAPDPSTLTYEVWDGGASNPAPTVTAAEGGGGSSSPAVKIENANVKFFGKTKFVV